MTRDITISVGELRTALNELLDAVEKEHGSQVALEDTAYWDLPVEAAFDLTEPDPVLTVGEVCDDIDAVRDLTPTHRRDRCHLARDQPCGRRAPGDRTCRTSLAAERAPVLRARVVGSVHKTVDPCRNSQLETALSTSLPQCLTV